MPNVLRAFHYDAALPLVQFDLERKIFNETSRSLIKIALEIGYTSPPHIV
jgi:hypothetical protein